MINSGHRCPLLVLPVKVTGALPRRYQQNTQGAFAGKLQNSSRLKIVCLNMIKYFIPWSSEVCLRTRAAVTVEMGCLVPLRDQGLFFGGIACFGKHAENIC